MTRVLVIGPTDADSFADNVGETLTRMGHDVRMAGAVRRTPPGRRLRNAIEIASDRLPKWDRRRQRHLVAHERDFRPDVILTLDRRIQPEVVRELRTNGARIALWFPDAVYNLGRHDVFLAPYDRLFFKNPRLVAQLRDVHGVPVSYLPEAANARWHRSDEPYGEDEVLVVAGNVHPTRALLIDRLVRAGIPIAIYGPMPPAWIPIDSVRRVHTGQYVTKTRKADVFRRARGVINNLHPAEFAGMNCRLFEAAASGAAVITEEREGLDALFDPGREVLPFASFEGLVAQCERVLGDRAVGALVGDAAATRAHAEHTYESRLTEILQRLE